MTAVSAGVRGRRVSVLILTVVGGGGATITDASATTPPASAAQRLVAHARWTHPAAGYRLHVTPTHAGRNRASTAPHKALNQAISSAGTVPFTMTTSVHHSLLNQLKCHAVFASGKPHWNLEAWRPDVGYAATVRAFCNP